MKRATIGILATVMVVAMTFTITACGNEETRSEESEDGSLLVGVWRDPFGNTVEFSSDGRGVEILRGDNSGWWFSWSSEGSGRLTIDWDDYTIPETLNYAIQQDGTILIVYDWLVGDESTTFTRLTPALTAQAAPTPTPNPEPKPESGEIDLWSYGIDNAQLFAMVESGEIPANVTHLNLERNKISDISPLAGLTNLAELRLTDNEISDISPLAGLANLSELGLGRNEISDISPLAGLTNLTTVALWGNEISDITPLAGLTNLTTVGLSGNQISDWSPVAHVEEVSGRP